MKQNILKSLMLIAVLLTSINAFAHDFEADGIYYSIISKENKTVTVTYRGSNMSEYSNEYMGSVVIPENVTYNSLTYSVTSIDYAAFAGCTGLTSVTIPNSVTSIGTSAFAECTSLNEIICESATPPTAYSFSFFNVPTTATLYVPIGSRDAYTNATGWNYFTNILEDDTKTSVESTLADNDVNVSVENGNIIVYGADNAKVEVYSVNGQCVYNGTATTIPVNTKGLYIVKVGDTTQKVVL